MRNIQNAQASTGQESWNVMSHQLQEPSTRRVLWWARNFGEPLRAEFRPCDANAPEDFDALLEMADSAGASFTMPETHEDLANRLGTVREVVSRNLGRFQSEGLIRLHRKDVQILDRKGLAAEAETNF